MQEIAKLSLENEMDLILAHRRSMKLAELAGLTLSAQTTFATAVSEVSRSAIEHGKNGCLILGIGGEARKQKFIVARVEDESQRGGARNSGVSYAKKLVNRLNISSNDKGSSIELYYHIPNSERLDHPVGKDWRSIFEEEQPVSPYDEIKRKNEQLKELAERLQQSEARYRTLTNTLPQIIFSLDDTRRLTYVNDSSASVTAASFRIGEELDWERLIHADDLPAFRGLMRHEVINETTGIKTQVRLLTNAEHYIWHLISITPLKDEKGNLTQWIGFCVDIHAQKEYEQTLRDNEELKAVQAQLEENVQELNRSNYELQQFAFIASHDLQEPVRKVAIYSDYLLERYGSSFEGRAKGYLQGLVSASHRMRNLINDVLAFSQVNRDQTHYTAVDLNRVVDQALSDLELTIAEKQAVIQKDHLPVVVADESMMVQLFDNLLGNALKYVGEGRPPRVAIRAENDGGQVRIRIEDNGIGFEERHVATMFRLFQRLHSKDRFSGTGLGLAICQKIVELHDGKIEAIGKPNAGASFIITLPLRRKTNEE